jgi:acyl CoA:acetate/3-ketoacid CoA transferase
VQQQLRNVHVPGSVVDVLVVHERHRATDLAQPHEAAEPGFSTKAKAREEASHRELRKRETIDLSLTSTSVPSPFYAAEQNTGRGAAVPAFFAEEELDLMDGHLARQILHVQR